MCEYCGCQEAVAAVAELTAEHDLVVDLSGRVRAALAGGDRDEAARRAREVTAVLRAHTAVEERGLFPPLAEEFPDHVDALQQEHRLVEAVLGEAAAGTPTDPAWDGRVLDALAVLRLHILKEQDGVFPAALARLDATDWDRLDAVRAEVGSSVVPTRGTAPPPLSWSGDHRVR